MSAAVSYPGVYIEELPSGTLRGASPIGPVATATAAFIGRCRRGPVDEPVDIHSVADFTRIFGSLWDQSALGYAVRDFFANGGTHALVVRLFHAADPVQSHARLAAGGLALRARHPGAWGNALQMRIDHDVEPGADPADPLRADCFNLTVRDAASHQVEVFRSVSMAPGHPRRVDLLLARLSQLVLADGALPAARPAAHPAVPGDSWQTEGAFSAVPADRMAGADLPLAQADFTGPGTLASQRGLYALCRADHFNILCIPPYLAHEGDYLNGAVDSSLMADAALFCEQRRAMLLVDPPPEWTSIGHALDGVAALGTASRNAALFFPRLIEPVAERGGAMSVLAPCGAVAGVFARTDAQRGVWKAPAGMEAALLGVPALSVPMTDRENGKLNPLGINCLRSMPSAGRIVWGARTLQGDERRSSEWKYIPVRRTALYIEESVARGIAWVVLEANNEALWARLRLSVGAFLHELFRQGAFQGRAPHEAYFVKCDASTTSAADVEQGIVNLLIGFAPLKPGEFVLLQLRQVTAVEA